MEGRLLRGEHAVHEIDIVSVGEILRPGVVPSHGDSPLSHTCRSWVGVAEALSLRPGLIVA